jgi:hypothetical protein
LKRWLFEDVGRWLLKKCVVEEDLKGQSRALCAFRLPPSSFRLPFVEIRRYK